ncbi:hypothetical protein EZS27_034424, partial [termite gut metagenome]
MMLLLYDIATLLQYDFMILLL